MSCYIHMWAAIKARNQINGMVTDTWEMVTHFFEYKHYRPERDPDDWNIRTR